jgi:acetyl esterase/lipase
MTYVKYDRDNLRCSEEGNPMYEIHQFQYGSDPSQFAELFLPSAPVSRGVAVVVHGGYWKSEYGAELGAPLAADLASRGYPSWNIEYRRKGNGGGWPETFLDVASGIDLLRNVAKSYELDLSRVVALGHSAGGHLAVWAAGREKLPSGAPGSASDSPNYLPLTAVVSQSGVLDLNEAARLRLDDDAVLNLLGFDKEEDPESFRIVNPIEHLPIAASIFAVHTTEDDTVPVSQSADYAARALETGSACELHLTPGDHYVLIDPEHAAYRLCRDLVERSLL